MVKLLQNYEFSPEIVSHVLNSNVTIDIILKFILTQNIKHIVFIDWNDFLDETMYNDKILNNITEFINNNNFNGMFFISNKSYEDLLEYEYTLNLTDCFVNIKKTDDFTTDFLNKKYNYIIPSNVDKKIKHIDIIDYTLKQCYGNVCMDIEIFYITRNFCNFSESAMFKRFINDSLYNFRIIYYPTFDDESRFGSEIPEIKIDYNKFNEFYYNNNMQNMFSQNFLQLLITK